MTEKCRVQEGSRMWQLELGKPFCAGRTEWEPGTLFYRFDSGTDGLHILQINQRGVSVAALQAFCAGAVHMGLFVDSLVPFVLIRIDGFYEWSDLPSSASLLELG
jgi:hypothetical protein